MRHVISSEQVQHYAFNKIKESTKSTYTHTIKTIGVDLCGDLQWKYIVNKFAAYKDF